MFSTNNSEQQSNAPAAVRSEEMSETNGDLKNYEPLIKHYDVGRFYLGRFFESAVTSDYESPKTDTLVLNLPYPGRAIYADCAN